MGQVKGSAVTARIKYVREKHGEDGYRALVDAVGPAHRATIQSRVLPHAWVDYELFLAVSVEADRLFGAGDLQLCYQLGRYAAEVNLPTLYRIFYQFANPWFVFQKAARLWDVHYDSGRLVVARDGDRTMRIRIEDFARPHRAHCLSVYGWASRSIELSGAEIAWSREERCRGRGDPACEFALEWK